MPQRIAAIALALAAAGASGCVMFNDAEIEYSRHTTVGQELLDLSAAKDKGLVSDAEYARTRKAILEGGPLPKGDDDDD